MGAILWLAARGGTLNVIVTEAGGTTKTISLPFGANGALGTWPGDDGSLVEFKVSGPPGPSAIVSVVAFDKRGKAGTPCVMRFGAGGATINVVDPNGNTIRTIKLVGRSGPPPLEGMLLAALLSLALFGIYIALIQTYRVSRLEPLLAGLPRSNERIGIREGLQLYAANMSNKLLVIMGGSAAMMVAGEAANVAEAIFANRSIDTLPLIVTAFASAVLAGQAAYLAVLKLQKRRSAV